MFTVDGTSGNTKTNGKLAVNGVCTSWLTTKELYVNGDIEADLTDSWNDVDVGTDADIGGNTEMTGTLSVGGTHADTDKGSCT